MRDIAAIFKWRWMSDISRKKHSLIHQPILVEKFSSQEFLCFFLKNELRLFSCLMNGSLFFIQSLNR